jgi:hypothetical protein
LNIELLEDQSIKFFFLSFIQLVLALDEERLSFLKLSNNALEESILVLIHFLESGDDISFELESSFVLLVKLAD